MSPGLSKWLIVAGSKCPKISYDSFSFRLCFVFSKETYTDASWGPFLCTGGDMVWLDRSSVHRFWINSGWISFVLESTNSPLSCQRSPVQGPRVGISVWPLPQSPCLEHSRVIISLPLTILAASLFPICIASIDRMSVPENIFQWSHVEIICRVTVSREFHVTIARREHGYASVFFENLLVFDYHARGHERRRSILHLFLLPFCGEGGSVRARPFLAIAQPAFAVETRSAFSLPMNLFVPIRPLIGIEPRMLMVLRHLIKVRRTSYLTGLFALWILVEAPPWSLLDRLPSWSRRLWCSEAPQILPGWCPAPNQICRFYCRDILGISGALCRVRTLPKRHMKYILQITVVIYSRLGFNPICSRIFGVDHIREYYSENMWFCCQNTPSSGFPVLMLTGKRKMAWFCLEIGAYQVEPWRT